MTKAPAGAMQRLSYSDPHLEPYMYVRIVGIPCTLHVLEHGSSSYHTTHTSMPCTSAYSTYSMYLILEADTVEEVHCEASPLLGLVPNLNLITAVRMMYTRSALVVTDLRMHRMHTSNVVQHDQELPTHSSSNP